MVKKRRDQPKPPPILMFYTVGDGHWAESVLTRLDEIIREIGGSAKRAQFVSMLINPGTKSGSLRWRDDQDRPRAMDSAASRVARARLDAVRALRAEGLTREGVGALMGLSEDAIKAIEDRATGERASQKRVSLKDYGLLAEAKRAAASIDIPPGDGQGPRRPSKRTPARAGRYASPGYREGLDGHGHPEACHGHSGLLDVQ